MTNNEFLSRYVFKELTEDVLTYSRRMVSRSYVFCPKVWLIIRKWRIKALVQPESSLADFSAAPGNGGHEQPTLPESARHSHSMPYLYNKYKAAKENEKLSMRSEDSLYDIAVRHAETTMQNHFREDGSCYHVAVYDTLTGAFIKGVTHQGYADHSMWARGQSWAIYGYTMVYRFTKEKHFLDFAQKVTDIYLKRLKETSNDWIPLWDMDDPRGIRAPKDASAACVVASALMELQQYVDADKRQQYLSAAEHMLTDLSTDQYQSREQNTAFLLHSTGHHPAGSEINASIIYADYYYLEALLRWKAYTQTLQDS